MRPWVWWAMRDMSVGDDLLVPGGELSFMAGGGECMRLGE